MPVTFPRPRPATPALPPRAAALTPTVLALALAQAAFAAPPPESPFAPAQPAFFGQVRSRTEYNGKLLPDTSANKRPLYTQLRSRLGFTAMPSEKVEVRFTAQDSRNYGSEPASPPSAPPTATTGNLKGMDLLEGYVAVEEGNLKVALGRQRMSLGAGRFLSTLEWSPYSRAFDGLAANWRADSGNVTALAYLVRDTSAATVDDRDLLSGLYYTYRAPGGLGLGLDLYAFYDHSALVSAYSADTVPNYDLYYPGERIFGKAGIFAFEEEFTYQAGKLGTRDSKGWQLALRAGLALPLAKVNLGLDGMSGDANPASGGDALYRANYYFAHAYFGWMDYFVNNPKAGVLDYRLDGDVALWGEAAAPKAALKSQYHYFIPQDPASGQDQAYGQEVDAEVHLALYPKSNIVLGAAAFFPGASAARLPVAGLKGASQGRRTGVFLYCMPTFNF